MFKGFYGKSVKGYTILETNKNDINMYQMDPSKPSKSKKSKSFCFFLFFISIIIFIIYYFKKHNLKITNINVFFKKINETSKEEKNKVELNKVELNKDISKIINGTNEKDLKNNEITENIKKDINEKINEEKNKVEDKNETKNVNNKNEEKNKDELTENISKTINNEENNIINFMDLIPRINISDDKNITDIKQIFFSRRLFINDKNITKEYIKFIRPIDENEEEKYNKILFPNLTFYDYPNETRKDQYSLEEYYNLCKEEKLLDKKKYNELKDPFISIVLPVYNKKDELLKSLRSIQNQSFKNIEIIIIDDGSTDDVAGLLEELFESEPRLRIFKHLKNMGVWRTRMDGFLYSKGKYILHFDPGDFYADNYVLEDSYNLVTKYNLDTVKFSFIKEREHIFVLNITQSLGRMKIYPKQHTEIIYGRPDYNVRELGYGTIWNRLVRANVFVKGLELVDEFVLNAYKNLWEDMWWCDLVDRVSTSNLIVNRLGYLYLCTYRGAGEPKIFNSYERDRTIREFIYFWFFDYQLLPKNDTKKNIVNVLRDYNRNDNQFCRLPMRLDFLNSPFPIFERLLNLLINDSFVDEEDKIFVRELLHNTTERTNN